MTNDDRPKIDTKSEAASEDSFIELLGNKYTGAIMSLTSVKECSALQVSHELNIPIATVYRKLKLLEDSGFIQPVKIILHPSGNEEKYYRCIIRDATVKFQSGKLSVNLNKTDYMGKIIRLWKRLDNHEK